MALSVIFIRSAVNFPYVSRCLTALTRDCLSYSCAFSETHTAWPHTHRRHGRKIGSMENKVLTGQKINEVNELETNYSRTHVSVPWGPLHFNCYI